MLRSSIVQPDCTKAKILPREEFQREVEKTGQGSEGREIIYLASDPDKTDASHEQDEV
jgi:hypothetical protein